MVSDVRRILPKTSYCSGCSACYDKCVKGAISMKADAFGFEYPSVDGSKCANCGACLSVCPMQEAMEPNNYPAHYYGARLRDTERRLGSSSGAVFFALADWFIGHGGCVVGASMDEGGFVHHIVIDAIGDIDKLTKTKYVQSSTKGIYKIVSELLKSGRNVMFVGTPCQTEAIRKFAGDYTNALLLVDLVCYGVPSPKVWARYVNLLERKYTGKLEAFFFRDKRNDDDGHTAVAVVNGKEHAYSMYSDKYCKSYFKNVNIRESCLNCRFATPDRLSDITLGDFWGIEKVREGFSDRKGTSLVIVHSAKGQTAWETVKGQTEWFACEREDAMQPRLQMPTEGNLKRRWMISLFNILPLRLWLKVVSNLK